MADLITFNLDPSGVAVIEAAMRRAANRTPDAVRRAVNWCGDRAKTKVVNALTKQTGLKRGVILRAVVPKRANYGSLAYVMRSRGGDISLKYFGARETRAGVTAAPWGQRQLYAGAFKRGGQFPNRVPLPGLNGHVFKREGEGRLPIHKQRSGLFIPIEMTKGETAEAFTTTVTMLLPARVEHEVGAILAGFVR